MDKSKLEELLQEIIKSGAGAHIHRASPTKLIVSPTMLRAAEIILESNKAKSHEIKVDFK